MNMDIKKVYVVFLVVCVMLIPLSTVSCFLFGGSGEEPVIIQPTETSEGESAVTDGQSLSPDEEIDLLLENEDFLDVLSSFDYRDSTIKDAKQVEGDEDLLFILLESEDSFEDIEEYYKDIKVKSVWIRSEIFEKSSEEVEEEFIDSDNENVQVSKFTYSNLEKDKVVNVLIKGLEEGRTQIMIIYWNLQQ
jgi:hypothetical protein